MNQYYGDGILAVFGFPTAREDDAKRAIEAALELRAAAGNMNPIAETTGFELRMHIGVHSGLVFVRDGDALHGKYDLTGDAVNTAARLCSAAGRDEILVSETALRGNEAFFAGDTQVVLSLKGKRTPVIAFKVTARSSVQSRFEARTRRGLTEFIARDAELAELETLLDDGSLGQVKITVIAGPGGIGKSRLLEEFRALAAKRDVRLLFGCCAGAGEMIPLEPFIHALRQWFGIQTATCVDEAVQAVESHLHLLGEEAENHCATLLQLLSLPVSPASKVRAAAVRTTVEEVLSGLISKLAVRSPLFLVLDDWQWADDTSRKVLNNLRRLADMPMGIVLAMRDPELTDPALQGARVLRLTPFSEEQTAVMIRALRPEDLELRAAPAIHRRSGGNPLFVEELCRSLPKNAQGEHVLEQSGAPSTLQGVIQARIGALPLAQAELLRVAAVIGPEFALSLLSQVAEVEDLAGTLTALVREDVVYATERDGSFRFKHGIMRDVIYETVRIAERRRIHHAIARAIERSVVSEGLADQSEALAYHYAGAGDHENAASYADLAGNKALAASALDRARFQYEAALAALDRLSPGKERLERWVAISIKWAGACLYNAAPYQLPLLERASRYASELGNEAAHVEIEYLLGWIQYGLGEYDQATEHCRRALASNVTKEEWFVAQLYANLGQCHAVSGQYADALVALTRSIDMRRNNPRYAPGQPVSQGFAYSLASRALVSAGIGDFSAADADIEHALTIVHNSKHPVEGSVLALEAMVESYRGRWERCAEVAAASCTVAERVYSAYVFSISSALGAYANFMRTHSAESLLGLRNAIQWLERHDFGLKISLTYGLMAEASVAAGDLDSANDYARRALERAARSDPLGEIMAHRALARRAALRGATAAAEVELCLQNAFVAAEKRGSRRDSALTRLLQSELCLRAGDHATSRTAASDALSEFEAMGMSWYAEKASRLLELLNRG